MVKQLDFHEKIYLSKALQDNLMDGAHCAGLHLGSTLGYPEDTYLNIVSRYKTFL